MLAPGGSPDPAQRQVIISKNQAAWELSHQIFAIAFAFLFWWLLALWERLKARSSWLTGIGVFLTGFALLADFGIATLQFVALEAAGQTAAAAAAWQQARANAPTTADRAFIDQKLQKLA